MFNIELFYLCTYYWGKTFLLRWRKEGTVLLQKQQKQIEEQQKQLENQSRLLKLIAKATGIEVEESWSSVLLWTLIFGCNLIFDLWLYSHVLKFRLMCQISVFVYIVIIWMAWRRRKQTLNISFEILVKTRIVTRLSNWQFLNVVKEHFLCEYIFLEPNLSWWV